MTTPHDDRSGAAWLAPTVLAIGSLILGLVLWQCTTTQPGSAAPSAEQGLVLFREAGCGACHGQTGEGGSGPALGGFSAEQVIRQVRAPYGAMPMFAPAALSDADLDSVVEFVAGLDPVERAVDREILTQGFDPRDDLAAHHWLALRAIQNDDHEEAVHQIDHINVLIVSDHLFEMHTVTTLLDIDVLDAEQKLLSMVAGSFPETDELDHLNARLAVQAILLDDMNDASRHLGTVETGVLSIAARQALDALEAGEPAVASELLTAALAQP